MNGMATTEKPTPPKPPKLASKEEAAAVLAQHDDEQGEGTIIDRIRGHMDEIDTLLNDLEAEQ
jgi:hypothetical protein